jgi:hypothetical protein
MTISDIDDVEKMPPRPDLPNEREAIEKSPVYPKRLLAAVHRLALVLVVREFEYDPRANQPFKCKETNELPIWLDSAEVSEDERKLFYEGLLRIPWLPARVRSALLKETGTSRRQIARFEEIARTFVLWHEVNECKDRMRRERDRYRFCKNHPNMTDWTDWYKKLSNVTGGRVRRPNPVRGSLHEAAIEEVAAKHGMTAAALKKRIQRHRPSQLLTSR